MREPIQKYFQVGTIQWMSHPPNQDHITDSVHALCCDSYFDAIEIGQMPDDETKTEVIEMLGQSHMKVCYGAQPRLLGTGLNPNDLDEEQRKAALKTLMEGIDEAQELGAQGIAFLSGKWEKESKSQAFEQLLKTTRALCDYAKTKEMMVELEVFDYDMDKAALIGPAPYAAEFAREIRKTHDNFGLLVDLSHFPTTYESSKFVVETCKEYITHFHIGNVGNVKYHNSVMEWKTFSMKYFRK